MAAILSTVSLSSGIAAEGGPMASSGEHPRGIIKGEDVSRARANLQQYAWAREYAQALERECDPWLSKITPAFLEEMIPETTPLSTLLTPCPACRDLGKPLLPHGKWTWNASDPNRLSCGTCGAVFPNEKHPETIALHSKWGKPQTFTFDGGAPIPLFRYKNFRPSISGNIRARKVDWTIRLVRKLGELYALTAKPEYAQASRAILLKLAEVYPFWLVHSGYGEFADMDPKIAAENINQLPENELVYPPNKPDRELFAGYWAAGRASGIGIEGIWVEFFATAYDLTCSAKDSEGEPIYSEAEKKTIETHLLKESTVLLHADKIINNKSVNNRSSAALVGIIVGDPDLVRFGIEGFDKLINSWFLPDGGTPESPAYALMALDGCATFVQALRGYSDPAGYRDGNGHRYDRFDPYRETHYEKIWAGMFNTLQGDLCYPPFADSYPSHIKRTALDSKYAELMADNYPERLEYMALLKAYAGEDWSKVYAPYAIYYGNPGREKKEIPPLVLKSNCLPDLRIGYLRSGEDGRESLLLLSASHWGEHHHEDSLNLYYWKDGEELLSDLGYLWDHPNGRMTLRTFAHNLVIINGVDQATATRGGDVRYFIDRPAVRAMRASSKAYPDTAVYERAVALLDHGGGKNYAVDVFWVQGGRTQDYVYHGPNQSYSSEGQTESKVDRLYDLKNVRRISPANDEPWLLTWKIKPSLSFSAWNIRSPGEKSYIGDGWGQRDSNNRDLGATIPYIVRRTKGEAIHAFATVFEGHAPDKAFVKRVQRLPVSDAASEAVALQIDTENSRDYVMISSVPQNLSVRTPDGLLECTGAMFAAVSVKEKALSFSEVDAGSVAFKPAAPDESK